MSKNSHYRVLFFAILFCVLQPPFLVVAQETLLEYGIVFRGNISPEDPVDIHKFYGSVGDDITISASGESELDTHLLLVGPNNQTIAENDDTDGSTNSLINVVLPEDGIYQVIVTRYQYVWGETTGNYRFSLKLNDSTSEARSNDNDSDSVATTITNTSQLPYLGIFTFIGGELTELPRTLGGPQSSNLPEIDSANPEFYMWLQELNLSLFYLADERQGGGIDFTNLALSGGGYTLRLRNDLAPGVYCFTQSDPFSAAEIQPHWCFTYSGTVPNTSASNIPPENLLIPENGVYIYLDGELVRVILSVFEEHEELSLFAPNLPQITDSSPHLFLRFEGAQVSFSLKLIRGGIGVVLGANNLILGTVSGGGAENAGLQSDDTIIAIDGQNVSDNIDTMTLLGGNIGTSVEVTVLRGTQTLTRTVIRQAVGVESVESTIHSWDNSTILMRPEFPLSNGRYCVIVTAPSLTARSCFNIVEELDTESTENAAIESIYPSVHISINEENVLIEREGHGIVSSISRPISSSSVPEFYVSYPVSEEDYAIECISNCLATEELREVNYILYLDNAGIQPRDPLENGTYCLVYLPDLDEHEWEDMSRWCVIVDSNQQDAVSNPFMNRQPVIDTDLYYDGVFTSLLENITLGDANVIYVNGILNSPDDHKATLQSVSATFPNQNVIGIYNASVKDDNFQLAVTLDSAQAFDDLSQAFQDVRLGSTNLAVDSLVTFLISNPNPISIVAHSQGASITAAALHEVELRGDQRDLSNITVYTFGGFSISYPEGPLYRHCVFASDPIPLIARLMSMDLNPVQATQDMESYSEYLTVIENDTPPNVTLSNIISSGLPVPEPDHSGSEYLNEFNIGVCPR